MTMQTATSRADHLRWCKGRALAYVDRGDTVNAFNSFTSDMQKHDLTANHAALELGAMLLIGGHLSSERQMREWIEGFN